MKKKINVKRKNISKYIGIKRFVDIETGIEIPFRVIGTKQEFVDKGFFKIFTAFSKKIVEDADIAGKSIRLLFYIMSEKLKHIDEIEFSMSPNEVCSSMKISERTYRRWVSTLIEKDIIKRIGPNKYMINPENLCIGKANRLVDLYYKTENYKTGTNDN